MCHNIINLPTNSVVNKEEYVQCELQLAASNKKGLIVLNFGGHYVYNSTIMSLLIVHKDRVVVVSPNNRFKQIVKILKADELIRTVDNLEDVDKVCDCDDCRKSKEDK